MQEISNRNAIQTVDPLDYSEDAQHTQGVSFGGFPIAGLIVPITNGTPTITVEVSPDGGTTWFALKESDGSTAAISVQGQNYAFALGSDELTQLAAYSGPYRGEAYNVRIRLALSVAQTADREFTWIGIA